MMADKKRARGSDGGKYKLKIMLSGFDAEAEKTYMTNIIKRLSGVYLNDDSNPQAFVPECTHIICKKPNRSEKYLAGCASGKWILTPYFLHNSDSQGCWATEELYEWGVNISPMYSSALQQAPKRWRETIKVKNRDPPFLGWSVGLVMKQSFIQAYTRIIEAGGGAAVDISSWYTPESANRDVRTVNQGLLTHILVTPHMVENVMRYRTEEILCLKAEYLAQFLLNDPPPSIERYSLFRMLSPSSSSGKHVSRKFAGTGISPKSKVAQEIQSGDETETSQYSFGSGVSSDVLRRSPAKESISLQGRIPNSPRPVQTPKSASQSPSVSRLTSPPDVASSLKPGNKCVISTVKVQTTNKPGSVGPIQFRNPIAVMSSKTMPNLLERSLFKTFENSENLLAAAAGAAGRGGHKKNMPHLQDIGKSLPKTSQRQTAASSPGSIPDISLGKKRSDSSTRPANSNRANTSKQHFTDEFFDENFSILQEFAGLKKHHNTPYGMVEDLFAIDNKTKILERTKERCARPFSRDVVTSLEASLEVNYRHGYLTFLKEVSGRICATIYPPPDVIYVIMKVILLDTDNPVLASSSFAVLKKIMELHPPQAPDIKASKLYHKAFTVMTVPDEAEPSPIMLAVGCMLSQTNENWSLWCNRDPTLGAHWTFYSRVLHIAISTAKPTRVGASDEGAEEATLSPRRIRNAVLLTIFLTKLVEKDYEDVITRSDFPTNNPMIKCLIADLLWPAMTGLEPWFRRPSPNLADLVSLFVKAVEIRVSRSEDDFYTDDDVDELSDDEESDDENSQIVLDQIGRLLTVTASWCVYCDLREKERGKRSASRPLEFELVKALRSELDEVKPEVLELALENLPPRLRLKVNAALIKEACTEQLVAEDAQTDPETSLFEELSLEIITSRYMQLLPLQAENETEGEAPREKYIKPSEPNPDEENVNDPEPPQSPVPAPKTVYKVNKRNAKGETALHIACMQNKHEIVRHLLQQPGINPNLTDYAGWTPLGEACNHGHIECVEALLELPVKRDKPLPADSDGPPVLKIDVTLCPQEGQTPLHDALGNGHLDIACLLVEKGGVELLDKVDSDGKTALDCCSSDAARAYMIEYAWTLADKERRQKMEAESKAGEDKLMSLADEETFQKAAPSSEVLASDAWRGKVRWYFWMISLLVSHYVTSGYLIRACFKTKLDAANAERKNYHVKNDVVIIDDSDDDINQSKRKGNKRRTKNPHNNVSTSVLRHFANDVTFCLRWQECWVLFKEHIKRLVGGDKEFYEAIVNNSNTPIPTDWISDLPL